MPINGLVAHWDAMELRIASSGSVSHSGEGVGIGGHSASGNTLYTPDAIDLAVGLAMQASASLDEAGVWAWNCFYDGPFAPFGGLVRGGTGSSAEVRVVLSGIRLYSKLTGSLWRLSVENWKVYCNGSLEIDQGPLDATSDGVGPNYIPVLGIPLSISGSCSAATVGLPIFDENDTYDYQTSTSATAQGGWRFKEAGSSEWISLPVQPPGVSAPSAGTCALGVAMGAIGAGETWDASIGSYSFGHSKREYIARQEATADYYWNCRDGGGPVLMGSYPSDCLQPGGGVGTAKRDVYKETNESESRGASVRLVPDLPKTIQRFAAGYRALWWRGPMPYVRSSGSRTCSDDGVTSSATATADVHPAQAQILACVGDDAHAIEDTLGYGTYAPCQASGSKSYSETYPSFIITGACGCPPINLPAPPDGCSEFCDLVWPATPDPVFRSESASYAFPSEVGPAASPQGHAVGLARYLGHQANPHWHYYHWREDWEVDGASAPWADYWGPLRQQWLDHPALPGEERRKTRTHHIGSALERTGHSPWLDTFAAGLRWIGTSRWQTTGTAPAPFRDLDGGSAAAWTVEGAEAVFSPSWVVLTPSAASAELTLEVGRWDSAPYLYPLICDRLRFSWETTGIARVRVYAMYADGSNALFRSGEDDFTSAGVDYRLPRAGQEKFAGTWTQDAGLGVVADVGTDEAGPPEGLSVSLLADPKRAFLLGLGRGRTPVSLRILVDFVEGAETANFGYPRWIYGGGHPGQYWTSGQVAALLWGRGPGARWGDWLFYDGSVLHCPPAVAGPGYLSTVIDALCFRRLVLEGVAHDGGTPNLTTELTQRFDGYEGQSVGQVDRDSFAFPLPKGGGETIRLALVNTFSEVPPLAGFPFRARDPGNWAATGTHAQTVYDWTQEASLIVTDAPAARLVSDTGVTWTHSVSGTPDGWGVAGHTHALENDESGFEIRRGDFVFAEVRPFRGWFGELVYEPGRGRCFLRASDDLRRSLGFIAEGTVRLWFFNVGQTAVDLLAEARDTGVAADWCAGAWRLPGGMYLLLGDEGRAKLYRLEREGGELLLATDMGSATSGDLFSTDDVTFRVYRLDAGTLKYHVLNVAGEELYAGDTNLTDLDDEPIACDQSVARANGVEVALTAVQGGTRKVFLSSDGRLFS